jgi:hypothetical protein
MGLIRMKLNPVMIDVWAIVAIGAVLADEMCAKLPTVWGYMRGTVSTFTTASTTLYGLQNPASPSWWLLLHIISATGVTLCCATTLLMGRRLFSEMPAWLRPVMSACDAVFTLTIILQLFKLGSLPWYAAICVNLPLLAAIHHAASTDSPIAYLATLSLPLALTFIATHIAPLVALLF